MRERVRVEWRSLSGDKTYNQQPVNLKSETLQLKGQSNITIPPTLFRKAKSIIKVRLIDEWEKKKENFIFLFALWMNQSIAAAHSTPFSLSARSS